MFVSVWKNRKSKPPLTRAVLTALFSHPPYLRYTFTIPLKLFTGVKDGESIFSSDARATRL